ncbi:hypothetical protein F6X37_18910 [Paraburkholderia sp. 31.1]|uniref:hypothetical protein n=1 Tax=Paraburkholderia sp. 31.1 TaxID=2615205 RepID=UPI0016563F7E|nr:hypothetical protein [Paraburkholderia sp. 31.1]MBC8723577.1 hypothetical protein [Paraburkholderia sp. 31.1]
MSPVKQSPYALQVEAATIASMIELHLIENESHLKRVQKIEISRYAGYAYQFEQLNGGIIPIMMMRRSLYVSKVSRPD